MKKMTKWFLLASLLAISGCDEWPSDHRAIFRVTNGAGDVQTVPTTVIRVEGGGLKFIDMSSTVKDGPTMKGDKFTIERVN